MTAAAVHGHGSKTLPARQRLLRIADELFYARGLHAVGIDEIIERSGTAKATLYAHFPTKDDLIGSYLRERSRRWRDHLTSRLTAHDGPAEERIDAVFAVLAEGCASRDFRGCPFINAAVEYPDPRHPASVAGAEHRAWILELFRSLATEAHLRRPDELAAQLALVYDSAMVGTQMNRNPDAASQARQVARVLVESARPSSTRPGRARRSPRRRTSRVRFGR
jgi:AcrR family transcriptional regulator